MQMLTHMHTLQLDNLELTGIRIRVIIMISLFDELMFIAASIGPYIKQLIA